MYLSFLSLFFSFSLLLFNLLVDFLLLLEVHKAATLFFCTVINILPPTAKSRDYIDHRSEGFTLINRFMKHGFT